MLIVLPQTQSAVSGVSANAPSTNLGIRSVILERPRNRFSNNFLEFSILRSLIVPCHPSLPSRNWCRPNWWMFEFSDELSLHAKSLIMSFYRWLLFAFRRKSWLRERSKGAARSHRADRNWEVGKNKIAWLLHHAIELVMMNVIMMIMMKKIPSMARRWDEDRLLGASSCDRT